MDILINELSLVGQYSSVKRFITHGLFEITNVLIDISITDNTLLKKYDFFNSNITNDITLHSLLKSNISREYDLLRKFKSELFQLIEDPFWESDKRHSDRDTFLFNSENINNSSLAEACERDRVVVSFVHDNFITLKLPVIKNKENITIDNLYDKNHFLELGRSRDEITFEAYVKNKFKKTNLDFSLIDNRNGFALLNTQDEETAFLSTFEKFIQMNWTDISQDDGLKYKPYNDLEKFKKTYPGKKICKFRTSQLYRCFGYREDDTFFVVRFEIEHDLSDEG